MRPVTRRAPGKLFIAGEYAVLEPGTAAILVAVDRCVSVTAAPSPEPGVTATSDLVPGEHRLPSGGGPLAHLASAVRVVGDLLAERGVDAPPARLAVASELHEGGAKYGLGSSGAVTVAAVSAYAAFCGVDLTAEQLYRLALLATARLDPRASGGDVAASVWGGWLVYRAPDRAAVLDGVRRHGVQQSLDAAWPGFGIRRLPAPSGAALLVGWTGKPITTSTLLSVVDQPGPYRDLVAATGECVRDMACAIERGDTPALTRQLRASRGLLQRFDDRTGAGIFTGTLTALCDAAEAVGGAGKPSGAGGGDCGIALVDHGRAAELRSRWSTAGIVPLPVAAGPPREE